MNNERGWTLFETLTALAVSGILIAGLLAFMGGMLKATASSEGRSAFLHESMVFNSSLKADLQAADEFVVDGNKLTLTSGGKKIEYYFADGKVKRKTGGDIRAFFEKTALSECGFFISDAAVGYRCEYVQRNTVKEYTKEFSRELKDL